MPDRRCVNRDSKEIRIPRNDLIRGRRTGIIITLLPISSETVETRKERTARSERERQREREGDQEKEREKQKGEREGTRGRNETRTASNVSL